MYSAEDLTIESGVDLLKFLPILIFCGLCGPFLIAAYTIGALSEVVGWLD